MDSLPHDSRTLQRALNRLHVWTEVLDEAAVRTTAGRATDPSNDFASNPIPPEAASSPAALTEYAQRSAEQVAPSLLSLIALARQFPCPLRALAERGATTVLNYIIASRYLVARRAIPVQPTLGLKPGGGLVATKATGVFDNVAHVDIANAYATVIVARQLVPHGDHLAAFPQLAEQLIEHRAIATQQYLATGDLAHRELATRLKRLTTALYGGLGSPHFLLRDPALMDQVAQYGRRLATTLVASVAAQGATILAIDTDGVYYTHPDAKVDHQTIATAAESDLRMVLGSNAIHLRLSVHGRAIITSGVRLARNLCKGLPKSRTMSRFCASLRDAFIGHVLAGRLKLAIKAFNEAYDQVAAGSVDPGSLAVRRSAGIGAPVVPKHLGDAPSIMLDGPSSCWCDAGDLPPGRSYSVPWALKELAAAFAPIQAIFDREKAAAGLRPSAVFHNVVLGEADDVAHTKLVAGLKTLHRPTASEMVRYGDTAAEDAFVALHGDAHGYLLGYYGDVVRPQVSARVRTGPFYMEIEHASSDAMALHAAKAVAATLVQHGAVPGGDVTVVFNGQRSFLIRVRQSALAVPDCVELHRIYGVFADAVYAAACPPSAENPAVLLDRALYRADATYRLVGVPHQETGFLATDVPWAALEAAESCASLRATLSQGVRAADFVGSAPVSALAEWFASTTAGLPTTREHDRHAHAPLLSTLERSQRGYAARKRRLRVLPGSGFPPCVHRVIERMRRGESIMFAPLAKAVLEARLAGMSRAELAHELTHGVGGPARYAKGDRAVQRDDGSWDISDSFWPENIDDTRYAYGCASPQVQEICDPTECPKNRSVRTYSETTGPTYTDARQSAFALVAQLQLKPGIHAYGVPPRSGKTRRTARLAVQAALRGQRVVVFAPTHRALAELARFVQDHLTELGIAAPAFAVTLFGRGASGEHCRPRYRSRRNCSGCPCHIVTEQFGRLLPNPSLREVQPCSSVIAADEAQLLAGRNLCRRTVSYHLGASAPILLASSSFLTNDALSRTTVFKDRDSVIIDEADMIVEQIADVVQLPLAQARQSADGPIRGDCGHKCADCHLEVSDHPSVNRWRGPTRLPTVHAHSSAASTLLAAAEAALAALEEQPHVAPAIDPCAARANVLAVARPLVDPAALLRGHHVPPVSYMGQILELSGTGRPGLQSRDADLGPTIRIPLTRCVDDSLAAPAHDSRHVWRRELVDDDEDGILDKLEELIDFTDYAAREGGCALLVLELKHHGARWLDQCRAHLQVVPLETARRLREFLEGKCVMMLSGTLPSERVLRGLLPQAAVTGHALPLHRDMTVFLHTVVPAARDDAAHPRAMECEELVALLMNVREQMTNGARGDRAPRIAVYAKTKTVAEAVETAIEEHPVLGQSLVRRAACTQQLGPGQLVVDYLRSVTSRAIDVDVELIVIYGNGYPNFNGYHSLAEVLNVSEHVISAGELAEDARERAVVQAALRSAALPGRRAVLMIGNLSTLTLPEWMRHRCLGADEEYRDAVNAGDTPERRKLPVLAWQQTLLASAIVRALRPRMNELPTDEELLAAPESPNGPLAKRALSARVEQLRQLVALGTGGSLVRPSAPVGGKQTWGKLLAWLETRGILRPAHILKGTAYELTEDGHRFLVDALNRLGAFP